MRSCEGVAYLPAPRKRSDAKTLLDRFEPHDSHDALGGDECGDGGDGNFERKSAASGDRAGSIKLKACKTLDVAVKHVAKLLARQLQAACCEGESNESQGDDEGNGNEGDEEGDDDGGDDTDWCPPLLAILRDDDDEDVGDELSAFLGPGCAKNDPTVLSLQTLAKTHEAAQRMVWELQNMCFGEPVILDHFGKGWCTFGKPRAHPRVSPTRTTVSPTRNRSRNRGVYVWGTAWVHRVNTVNTMNDFRQQAQSFPPTSAKALGLV